MDDGWVGGIGVQLNYFIKQTTERGLDTSIGPPEKSEGILTLTTF